MHVNRLPAGTLSLAVWTKPCLLDAVELSAGVHRINVSSADLKLVAACSVKTPTCTTDCFLGTTADKIPVVEFTLKLFPSILTPPRVTSSACGMLMNDPAWLRNKLALVP